MINKIKPIDNNVMNYWHRWKPYAHKCLSKYTNDDDLFCNLDGDLFKLFNRIVPKLREEGNIFGYIKQSIKGLVYRIAKYKGTKYCKREVLFDMTNDTNFYNTREYMHDEQTKLDTTINDWLMKRYVNYYLALLPERWATILKMYFGISPYKEHNLQEIAEAFGFSQARAFDIKKRAMDRLNKLMNNNKKCTIGDILYER